MKNFRLSRGYCIAALVFGCLNFMISSGYGQASENADYPALRLEVAKRLVQEGKLDQAIREYKNYLSDHPNSSSAYESIGSLLLEQKKYKSAVGNFRIAIQQNEKGWNSLNAWEGLAESYEGDGQLERAIQTWRELENRAKNSEQKKRARAKTQTLVKRLKTRDALASRQQSPTRTSTQKNYHNGIYQQKNFLQGIRYYQAGNKEKAIQEFRACLKAVPGHPGAYYYAGVLRYDKDQLSMAEYNFMRGFEYPEKGFNSYFYLGRIYQKKKEWQKSLGAYREYLKRTESESGKQTANKYINQVAQALAQEDPSGQKSITAIANANAEKPVETAEGEQTVRRTSNSPALQNPILAWKEEGISYFLPDSSHKPGKSELYAALQGVRKKKWDTSIRKLRELILKYSGSPLGYYASVNLSALYLQMGLYERALGEAEDVLRELPKGTLERHTRMVQTRSLIGMKQWEMAKNVLEQVEEGKEGVAFKKQVALSYAAIDRGEKRYQEAIKALKQAMKWSESPSETLTLQYDIANMYLQMGAKESAIEYYQKVVRLENSKESPCVDSTMNQICSRSQIKVADTWYQLKKWKKSAKAYEQFVEYFSKHEEVPWSIYQIANIARKQGKYQMALDNYRKVIETYPENYWTSQAKFKLEDAIWEYEYQGVLN